MAWALIIRRAGETPTISAGGAGASILANDKDMFAGELIPMNIPTAALPAPILTREVLVKTSRRIKVGDAVILCTITSGATVTASVGATVVAFEVH